MATIGIYQSSVFFIMYFIFVLFIISFLMNFRNILKQFKKIKRKTWVYLFIVFLMGLLLRLFVFPHVHLMYIDEPWYMEMAKNMNQKLQPVICEYPDYNVENCQMPIKAPGWPFLISIVFLIFGVNNYHALYFSSIIGSLSIILIFLLTYIIFRNQKTALWSSFFLALTPIHVMWSNSAETNNASVFFVLLTMVFFLIFIQCKKKTILVLTILSLLLTILTRFENIVLIGIFVLGYILFSKSLPKSSLGQIFGAFYPLIVVIMLIIIIVFQYHFVKVFRNTILTIDFYYLNLFEFLKVSSFNYVYLLLAAACLFLRNEKDKTKIVYLFTSFLIFFTLYLPIFSEDRMALMPSVFIIILSAYFLGKLCNSFVKHAVFTILLISIFSCLFGLNLNSTYDHISSKYKEHILETQIVMELTNIIPENCYLIAEWPTVFTSISNIKGVRTSNALNNPEIVEGIIKKTGCVYHFYDGYCTDRTISRPQGSRERCQDMLRMFEYYREKEFERGNVKYYLFRVNGLRY